ncbi:hypothetical protein [Pseudomonas sp. LB1P83]
MDGTYGMVTYPSYFSDQNIWVDNATNTPWDDNAPSRRLGVTYFPANQSLGTISAYVEGVLQTYLQAGSASGSLDIPVVGYTIVVSWLSNSAEATNEGFTISQMYPRID